MSKVTSAILRRIPRPTLQKVSHLILPVIGLKNRGNGVQCNVCGASYKKFISYGRLNKHRENALCPNCLALERHRLLWLYLQERTNFLKEPKRVLHIAPEYCFLNRFKTFRNLDYTTGDLVSPLADVHFDVTDIPFPDNQYDLVICNHVLEHVERDDLAMSEILRILKPGGRAILQVPQDIHNPDTLEDPSIQSPRDRERYYHQSDHVRLYGLDYEDRLREAGFNVKLDNIIEELSDNAKELHALPEDEYIYSCIKEVRTSTLAS